MKKLFTLLFALVTTTALWAQTFQVGDLYYNITSSVKPYTVEVTSGNYSGEVIIPETVTYNGTTYSVTRIGERAFQSCSITSVTIPASVISLEEYSFYQSQYINAVYLKSTTPPIINGGKIFITSHPTCYIPCGTLDAYQASKWANLMRKFVEEECKEEEEDDNTNIITYTTSDGNIVTPYASDVFDANIVSNEYNDGQGVITFDGPVTSIGEDAFSYCSSLTSITIPNSVTSIGGWAFAYCDSLASVTIGYSVTSIGYDAFYSCSSLTTTNYTGDIASWCNIKFGSFDANPMCYSQHFYINNQEIKDLVIPNTVDSIHDYAFFYCSSLASVTIGNSVTSIGENAFSGCSLLNGIDIPNSVTRIGSNAFSNCTSLTFIKIPESVVVIENTDGYPSHNNIALSTPNLKSIIVDPDNPVYDSREGCNAVIETATNKLIFGCQNTFIPNSVASIGYVAFYDCTTLTSIDIPSTVKSIREGAFHNTGIDSVYIPAETIVEDWKSGMVEWCGAFSSCQNLTNITFAEGIKRIPSGVIAYCPNIRSVHIPSSVTSIGLYAFSGCSSLTSITCDATIPPTLEDDKIFTTTPLTCYIPCGTLAAYEASAWASQVSEFVEEDCVDPTWHILYTSTDGEMVAPYASDVFGANIVSNEYKDGQGVITFDGPVTSIGDFVFTHCSKLASIIIPDSVEFIGRSAFSSCSSLTSITIPEGVTSIGEYAFMDCYKLISITIPESVNSMGEGVFANCSSLTSITIPNSVTSIGNSAFSHCTSLTSITIPNSVTSIGDAAFNSCSSFTSITIPESVTSIGWSAFGACSSLTSITIPNSVDSIEDYSFSKCRALASVSIGNSVKSIGDGVFNECSSLTSITIPNSVMSIGWSAFMDCSSLTSVTIGNGVTSIGNGAFWGCDSLNTIYLEATTPPTLLGADVFAGTPAFICHIPCGTKAAYEASAWAQYVSEFVEEGCVDPTWQILYTSTDGEIVTPYISYLFGANIVSNEYKDGQGIITFDGPVTSIGDYAFWCCDSLTSITIPNSVKSIGDWVFNNCSSLTSITIGNSVTSIGDWAFSHCTSLTSVTIPNSVTSIGWGAFYGCTSLTSITIGNSVTSIGDEAFYRCSSLTSMVVEEGNTIYDSRDNCNAIIESASNTLIAGCQNTIIPNSVTNIGYAAFYNCSSLTSITIGNSVTNIGDAAFYYCTSLTSVTIGNSVTCIGDSAFAYCSSLTSVTIPNSVTSIGDEAFQYCTSLASITIGNSVTSIGSGAFEYCSSLTSVTIGNSVTSIGESAFSECSSLTSVTIPESVTEIGWGAFYGCSSLTSITIGNSVTSIGEYAFLGCSSLNTIYLEATTPPTLLGANVFAGTPAFICYIPCGTKATYEASDWAQYVSEFVEEDCNPTWQILYTSTDGNIVTPYRSNVFDANMISNEYKDGQGIITFDGPVTSIGSWAFAYCDSLTSVTIPESVTSIGDMAFCNCFTLNKTNYMGDIAGWCEIEFRDTTANPISYSHNFYINDQEIKDLVIPNTVDTIHNYAFYNCASLTSVTIGSGVTSIGWDAFSNCDSLTSVTIPESVTSMGYSFHRCSSLTSVVWNANISSLGDSGPFWDCPITSFSFGENVKYIPDFICTNLNLLGSITIPNSVISIGMYAFNYCSSLTSITIPEGVTSIGGWAFANCSSLTSITIPNSITSIEGGTFWGCTSLTSITIPNNVTSIGWSAFSYCSSLTSITCEAMTPPTVEEHAFAEVSTSIPVYVPCGSENAYKAAYGWNDFTNIQGPLAEYSIQVSTSNSQMGTALVDYNTSCGNQITATANYGYHFVQWSDGNTDNPRTLVLTQDTTLIAEFAPNNYTLSVQSANTERGTTSGDVTTTYLDYVTISAIANYGYHFSHWNDYNYDNPRQLQVTENKTYTAYFDKNTYYITKNYDSNQGYVNGSTSGEYLDNITLTAEPKYGYHFLQWSDGNTDNPRTITLTQDTVLTAEFALTIAGQCGKNLYWVYDTYTTTLTITGSGDMYNERPWGLLAKDIAKVLLPYGITHIGNDAFRECLNLREITIPATVTSIGDQSFAGCRNLRNINCYPLLPPYAETTSFANYNVNLNVPCDYLEDYQYDIVFGSFKYINCMSSDEVEDAEDVEIDAGTTDVTIIWPTKENAYTYTIVIKKNGQVVCTLVFDAFGRLLNISFAPGRDGNHPAQYAEAVASGGFRFTVTGLEEGTDYTYDITTTDESDNTLATHSGEFTTQSNTPTDLENTDIQAPEARVHKLLRNGQLIILRDGVEYNAMGAEIQ